MAVIVDGTELVLTGTVGDLFFGMEDHFTQTQVVIALSEIGRDRDITVRINSPGGIAYEGAAIHAALAQHRGRKTIFVEGIAASAASVIAMAGDEVVMTPGSLLMIHDPAGGTFGTVETHQESIRALTALATTMAALYADRTGNTVEQERRVMRAETWFTPEEAVAARYADRVAGRAENDNEPDRMRPAAFAYARFNHPPERLVALADARGWNDRFSPAAQAASRNRQRGNTMPNENPVAGNDPAPTTYTQADLERVVNEALANRAATAAAASEPGRDTVSRADAVEIMRLCTEGGVPQMAVRLLDEGVSIAEARQRISDGAAIRRDVARARAVNPSIPENYADEAIAAGRTASQVVSELFNRLATADEAQPTHSHVPTAPAAGNGPARMQSSMERQLARAGVKTGA